MRLPLASAMAVTALLAAPAIAAPEKPGRYEMFRTEDGILRLDTATGAVSACRRMGMEEEWRCKPVSDPQLDLQREMEKAQREIEKLRKENEALRAALERDDGQAAPPPDVADKKQDRLVPEDGPEVSGEETIDQMMTVLEKMMRRFRDMIESYENRQDEEVDPPKEEHRL